MCVVCVTQALGYVTQGGFKLAILPLASRAEITGEGVAQSESYPLLAHGYLFGVEEKDAHPMILRSE